MGDHFRVLLLRGSHLKQNNMRFTENVHSIAVLLPLMQFFIIIIIIIIIFIYSYIQLCKKKKNFACTIFSYSIWFALRPPRCYGQYFPRQNNHTFSLRKTLLTSVATSLIQPLATFENPSLYSPLKLNPVYTANHARVRNLKTAVALLVPLTRAT